MNFPPLHDGCTSGRATPSLCRNHHAAFRTKPTNPAETHLTFAENCSNNRGQFSHPSEDSLKITKLKQEKLQIRDEMYKLQYAAKN
jgi:hypothetical protein